MSGTTVKPEEKLSAAGTDKGEQSAFERAGIRCPGSRPWLGSNAAEERCKESLVGALINQTNLYLARTLSAITLPPLQAQDADVLTVRSEIQEDASILGVAKTIWNMGDRAGAVAYVLSSLQRREITRPAPLVEDALDSIFDPTASERDGDATPSSPEPELLAFRRAEFNIIRSEVNDVKNVPDLRVIPVGVPDRLAGWIGKVNLVERLRETRVFYGFDRLEQHKSPLLGMPEAAMHQLFRSAPSVPHERWLPAIEVFGEGLYFELREDRLVEWQANQSEWLSERLTDAFITRIAGVFQTLSPSPADRAWASRYLLVHSLAHILINQLVFECGYSTASLRERLFVSADSSAPMAGFMIYTAAGDSEGTLGGLVRLGRPERLGAVIARALSRAGWCSADPVCSEQLGGQGSRLANLAACHACILLPETSCETINQGLDRAMVMGTPEKRSSGFMSDLLDEVCSIAAMS